MNKKVQINNLVHVHTVPDWLVEPLTDKNSGNHTWAKDYERLTKGDNLWRIWMVDNLGAYWLEVNYMNTEGFPIFNTLKLEQGTFDLIKTDNYEILSE